MDYDLGLREFREGSPISRRRLPECLLSDLRISDWNGRGTLRYLPSVIEDCYIHGVGYKRNDREIDRAFLLIFAVNDSTEQRI